MQPTSPKVQKRASEKIKIRNNKENQKDQLVNTISVRAKNFCKNIQVNANFANCPHVSFLFFYSCLFPHNMLITVFIAFMVMSWTLNILIHKN